MQIACGDNFSIALTQSGKVYSWGLANDGRLGVRRPTAMQILDKNKYTYHPQLLQFTTDTVENISACGQMAYCTVNQIIPVGKPGANTMAQTMFIWGKIQRGLNMQMNSQTNDIPHEFNEVKPYNFSSLVINNDFAIGVSHAAKITFEIPNSEGKYGIQAGGIEIEVLAVPCLD